MGEVPAVRLALEEVPYRKTHHRGKAGQASQGEFTFDKGNLDPDAFISIRETPGVIGNPRSFRGIEKITRREAKTKADYAGQINSLKEKIQKILEILKD